MKRLLGLVLLLSFSLAACSEPGDVNPALRETIVVPRETVIFPAEAPPGSPEDEAATRAAYPGQAQEVQGEAYPAPDAVAPALPEAYPGDGSQGAFEDPYLGPLDELYPGPEGEQVIPDLGEQEPQGLEAAIPPPGQELTGEVWLFSQFSQDRESIEAEAGDSAVYSVEFLPDGRVSVIAGCNTGSGTYSVDGFAISIAAAPDSSDPCDPPAISAQFLTWLNDADAFAFDGDSLLLQQAAGGVLRLDPVGALSFADAFAAVRAMSARSDAQTADSSPQTVEELMDATLDLLVREEGDPVNLSFGEAPGAVVLIESPQGSRLQARGLASVEESIAMGAFDRLEIGSNTKMFTAVLLAQLVEEGVLTLNDSLAQWLPDMAAIVPNGEVITLRQLATHTAGVPDYGDALIGAGAGDSEALRSGYTPQELVEFAVANGEADFLPGQPGQWAYSNTGYILLGMVLEAATGQSYDSLLQERIFDPLDMKDSLLLEGSPEPGTVTQGYFIYPYVRNTTEWNGSQAWSAGAIASTAGDMAKFARALMSGALFQDPATLGLMTDFVDVSSNPAVASVGGRGYGLGLIEMGDSAFGHRGQTIGFTSVVVMDPANDFILVALTNSAEAAVADEQTVVGNFLHGRSLDE